MNTTQTSNTIITNKEQFEETVLKFQEKIKNAIKLETVIKKSKNKEK